MPSAGTQNQQLALPNVDAENQATTRAAELDLEPSVVRWVYPGCSGYTDCSEACVFSSAPTSFLLDASIQLTR